MIRVNKTAFDFIQENPKPQSNYSKLYAATLVQHVPKQNNVY